MNWWERKGRAWINVAPFRHEKMKTSQIRKWIRVAVTTALCMLVAVEASAIDRDKLVQMAKIGLGDDEIMVLIDASKKEELVITEDELGELRLQGVSDRVIEHLKVKGYVVKGGSPDGGAAAPEAGGAATAVEGGAAEPAPGDVGTPGEYVVAPAEEDTQTVLTKEQMEAEMAKRVEKEREKALRQNKIKTASLRIPEANKLVESGESIKGARIFLELLALQPEEGTQEWNDAMFGFGKALYQEKIYSGASEPLLKVVKQGPTSRNFKEAFDMLEVITREINYQPAELEELSTIYLGDMNEEFQGRFNFYLGRFFFDYARSELAIEYFDKVGANSPKYSEAMYLKGAAKLDESVNDITGALRDFESAIRAAEAKSVEGSSEILQLGYLALARTFYEAGFYDVALYYYQKLPRTSSRNASATLEQAWTYFLKNDYRRALGTFHTLHSPYYSKWYYPDLYILEATVYLNLCNFEKSKAALSQFEKDYLTQKPKLEVFLSQTTEPKQYWHAMVTAYEKSAEESAIPRLFTNAVLDDLRFYNHYRAVQKLQVEQRALRENMASLGEFGKYVLKQVDSQLKDRVEEGGILVQQKLQELGQQLTDWEIRATQISFDIDSEDKAELEERLTNPNWKPAEKVSSGSTFMVVADDWQLWPFEGEYWFDEVSSYRSGLQSQCVER